MILSEKQKVLKIIPDELNIGKSINGVNLNSPILRTSWKNANKVK